MKVLLLTILAAGGTLARQLSLNPVLFSRQIVQVPCSDLGQIECGESCMPITSVCCPDSGYCEENTYCTVGTDGEPACCPLGEVCTGPGGVITNDFTFTHELTSAITIDVPGTVTDIPAVPTDEPEPELSSTSEGVPSPPAWPSSSSSSAAPAPGNGTSTVPPISVPTAGAGMNAMPVYIIPGIIAGAAMMAF